MANYFILYLQEHQKLMDVYRAFRRESEFGLNDAPPPTDEEIVSTVLDAPIGEIENNFDQWLRRAIR